MEIYVNEPFASGGYQQVSQMQQQQQQRQHQQQQNRQQQQQHNSHKDYFKIIQCRHKTNTNILLILIIIN